MKKSDLISGKHVVKMRDGSMSLVFNETVADHCGYIKLNEINENLTHNSDNDFDIVKVYEINSNFVLGELEQAGSMEEIWTRQEKSETEIKLEKLEAEQRRIADEIAEVRKGL